MPLWGKGCFHVLNVLKLTRSQLASTVKYREKNFKITKLKRKKQCFSPLVSILWSLIKSWLILARIWLKYECALGIVKFIYSFNKYLNVSKVMQFKALVTQVATLMGDVMIQESKNPTQRAAGCSFRWDLKKSLWGGVIRTQTWMKWGVRVNTVGGELSWGEGTGR